MTQQKLRVYIDIDGTILYDPPYRRGHDHLDLQLICDGSRRVSPVCGRALRAVLAQLSYPPGRYPDLGRTALSPPPIGGPLDPRGLLKTDAIDETVPFLWFEDGLERECDAWLRRRGLEANFFEVDPTCCDNPRLMLQHLKRRLHEM